MIAQAVLTVALLAVLAYAYGQRPRLRLFRASVAAICTLGMLVVWDPTLATRVANAVGIGRGADLIAYLWIILSFVITVNLHMRLRLDSERITQLAREIAILNASRSDAVVPGRHSPGPPEQLH